MKPTNLLINLINYPFAVIVGRIFLIMGVRFSKLPSIIILPLTARVAVVSASYFKFHEPENFRLDNPQLERELNLVGANAKALVLKANELRQETVNLLIDAAHTRLLVAVSTRMIRLHRRCSRHIAPNNCFLAKLTS